MTALLDFLLAGVKENLKIAIANKADRATKAAAA